MTGVLPTHDLLERINRELEKSSFELRRIPVGSGVEIFMRNDTIEKGTPPPEKVPSVFWQWRKNPVITAGKWRFTLSLPETMEKCSEHCAYFDGEKLPEVLEIAPPLPGERMIPFGSRSEKKIKKLRTDRRIHAETPFPVLRGEGKVFWAVTVRHSALAQVTPGTRLIVKIEFEEILT